MSNGGLFRHPTFVLNSLISESLQIPGLFIQAEALRQAERWDEALASPEHSGMSSLSPSSF
eukprot:1226148-Amphidinium_carterae.1